MAIHQFGYLAAELMIIKFIESLQPKSLEIEIKFLTKLERLGIDRKVDLIVKYKDSEHRLIFDTAKQTGILL